MADQTFPADTISPTNQVFIELTVDAFDAEFKNRSGKRQGAGLTSARRPLRGIEIKDDTYAVIRVIRATGEEVSLISSSVSGGRGPGYTNFLLQSVTDSRDEKVQIVETFGIPYIFFYGQRPHMLEIDALLLNTLDFNWEAEFWENYDKYLRGTKCAENGARVYLFYDDNIVEGYMLRATASKNAGDKGQTIPLHFSMLLTNYSNVSMVDSSTYPIRDSSLITQNPDGTNNVPGNSNMVPWLTDGGVGVPNTAPLRGDITDNIDEWVGGNAAVGESAGGYYQMSTAAQQQQQALLEMQNNRETIAAAAAAAACKRGCLANNPSFLRGLGLLGAGAGQAIKDANGATANAPSSIGTPTNTGNGSGGGIGQYAGGGAWAGAGIGPGGPYSGSGTYSGSSAGAGAGYYGGSGVGYNPFGGALPPGMGGNIGYYSGSGYFGPGQYGTPGMGAGSSPASAGFGGYSAGSGAYAGWSPGTGSYSGTYNCSGTVPPGYGPPGPGYAGSIWMPSSNYSGYGVMAGYSAGASAGYGIGVRPGYSGIASGAGFGAGVGFGATFGAGYGAGAGYSGGVFYGGYNGSMPYAAPGYAMGGYGSGTASSQYYASAYAGWDPVNGAYSGSCSGSPGNMQYSGDPPPNTRGPMPGQPGGGLFGVQSFPKQDGAAAPTPAASPYGLIDPDTCGKKPDAGEVPKGGDTAASPDPNDVLNWGA